MDKYNYAGLNSSPYVERLMSFVREHGTVYGFSEEHMWRVLQGLNVPANLRRFGWVTRQLPKFLDQFPSLEANLFRPENNSEFELNSEFAGILSSWVGFYRAHADAVSKVVTEVDKKPEPFDAGPSSGEDGNTLNPMNKKGMGRYSLYALLFVDLEHRAWHALVLRFILAHERVMRAVDPVDFRTYNEKTENPSFPVKPKIRADILRQMEPDDFLPIFAELRMAEIGGQGYIASMATATSLEAWIKQRLVERAPVNEKAEVDKLFEERLRRISRVIKFCHKVEINDLAGLSQVVGARTSPKDLRQAHYWGPGHVKLDDRSFVVDVSGDKDDPTEANEQIKAIYSNRSLHKQAGLRPNEIADLDLYDQEFEDPGLLLTGKSATKSRVIPFNAKGKMKAMSMANQGFDWQRDSLTLDQASLLVKQALEAIEVYSKGGRLQPIEALEYACWVLVLLMLCTGSRLDRAIDTYRVKKHEKPATSDHLLVYYSHPRIVKQPGKTYADEWWFHAIQPEYRSENSSFPGAVEKNNGFWMPDIFGLVPIVETFRKKCASDNRHTRMFLLSLAAYTKQLKKMLKCLAADNPIAEGITLRRIEKFLQQYLVANTRDIVTSSFITGEAHQLARVRLFYSAPNLNYLRRKMKATLEPLKAVLSLESSLKLKTAQENVHLGARHCVSKDAYKTAIERLKCDMRHALQQRAHGFDAFRNYHNLYALYAFWLVSFTLALRAIRNPLPTTDRFDDLGFISLRDKDTNPPYHSRLGWLPEKHLLFLKGFETHCRETAIWLELSGRSKDVDR